MRLSIPSVITGTLGALAQVAVNAINYLCVQLQGHGDAETNSSVAFSAYVNVPQVAAQRAASQIKNPAASGKVVYVDSLLVFSASGVGDTFVIGFHNADLLTDAGNEHNKNNGGAAAVAQLRHANSAGLGFATFASVLSPANVLAPVIVWDPPLRLDAGEGVACEGLTVNQQQRCTWQWREYNA